MSTMPIVPEAARRRRRPAALDAALPPGDAGRAGLRHVHHRRAQHGRRGGPLARGRGPVGGLQPRARDREHRLGRLRFAARARRDPGSRRKGPALRHRRASPARPDAGGHGRAQGPPSRDRGLHRDGRQRCGPQRRRGGGAAHGSPTTRQSNGIEPLAAIRSWAAVGVAPRRTGTGPDRRDPEGAGSGGRRRSATSISSRSTRPSARFPSPPRARSESTRRSATSTGAAAAWATRSPPPERVWSSPWSTSSGAEAPASAASPCARAAAWAWRWWSRRSDGACYAPRRRTSPRGRGSGRSG